MSSGRGQVLGVQSEIQMSMCISVRVRVRLLGIRSLHVQTPGAVQGSGLREPHDAHVSRFSRARRRLVHRPGREPLLRGCGQEEDSRGHMGGTMLELQLCRAGRPPSCSPPMLG